MARCELKMPLTDPRTKQEIKDRWGNTALVNCEKDKLCDICGYCGRHCLSHHMIRASTGIRFLTDSPAVGK